MDNRGIQNYSSSVQNIIINDIKIDIVCMRVYLFIYNVVM